jgi:hypothetical protein
MMKRFGMVGMGGKGKKGGRMAAMKALRGGGMPDINDLASQLGGNLPDGFPGR